MAQSVEMSAVTWPLLKLCFFSVISTVWEMVLLSETTQKNSLKVWKKSFWIRNVRACLHFLTDRRAVLFLSENCYDLDS